MKEEIIYGSHNSMTFLPPKHWWGYLGLWIARCLLLAGRADVETGEV